MREGGSEIMEKLNDTLSESDLLRWVQFDSLERIRIFKFINEISF